MAGSDSFARTQDLGGVIESLKYPAVIHIAITYDSEGMITAYRNGELYGKAYRKEPAIEFKARQARLLFGMRHGNSITPGRMWQGNLIKANLYDRALTEAEIQASSGGLPYIDRSQVIDAFTPIQRSRYQSLEKARAQLEAKMDRLGGNENPPQIWPRLAHSIFNLKEFIYIQ